MEVRFLNVQTVTKEQLHLWESWLSPEKRTRLAKMEEQRRLQSLCGDALARQMLSSVLNIAPQEIIFTYTENGKPVVDGAYFSISHSGELVGCVVAERPVGLDVEQIRNAPQRLRRAMGAEGESDEVFFRRWTKREALIKCRGETIARWMDQSLGEEGYTFFSPEVPASYCAAICEEV